MKTDRSRIISYQRCPRSRYWGYHHANTGIQPAAQNPHFLIGHFVHEGMDRLTLGNPLAHTLADLKLTHSAQLAEMLLDCPPENQESAKQETWDLIEALITVFARCGLAQLLEIYDVYETEREETVQLAPGIELMARTDAILKDKVSGDLYLGSWKTASTYDKRKQLEHLHDMQGVSEQFAVEPRLGKIMGVQMVHLIKGRYLYDEKRFDSPLVWAYRRWNSDENCYEWAHTYYPTCLEPHAMGKKMCPGGKRHKLGDEWEKVSVMAKYESKFNNGGIQGWLEDLASWRIQPNCEEAADFLERFVVIPPPIYRHQWELVRWHAQTSAQESRIASALRYPEKDEIWLDTYFPQYCHSCTYPGKCAFYEACWGGIGDPLDTNLFIPRKPNHPQEND